MPALTLVGGEHLERTVWHIYSLLEGASDALPSQITTGFLMSYACALAFLPIALYFCLRVIWTFAKVGKAYKLLCTVLILALAIPVYPLVASLVLALLAVVYGVLSLSVAVLGPIALFINCWVGMCIWLDRHLDEQKQVAQTMRRHRQKVQDISCCQLLLGLATGVLSLCTFGVVSLALTLLKSPLVVLSITLRFTYDSWQAWLRWTAWGCYFDEGCRLDWESTDEIDLEVQPSLTIEIDGEVRQLWNLRLEGAHTPLELHRLGATIDHLRAAGFTTGELVDADLGEEAWRAEGLHHEYRRVLRRRDRHARRSTGDILCLWFWFPLIFLAWLAVLVCGIFAVVTGIGLSLIVKLVAAVLWPAYVAAGWIGGVGARRRGGDACTPLVEGFKASYQVLWFSALLTNTCITNRRLSEKATLLYKACNEFIDLASGQRDELSREVREVSCLPPVVVGIFTNRWDLRLRLVAEKLGIAEDTLLEAWRSLARQMIALGHEAIADGLLTEDWVAEIPAALVVGLPSRVLLETIERSPPGELILRSGHKLASSESRPSGKFADKIWMHFQAAQEAWHAATLDEESLRLLRAMLLAGGGSEEELPKGLAEAVAKYRALPAATQAACQPIVNGITAMAIEFSRHQEFKDKLEIVVRGITSQDSSEYAFVQELQAGTAEVSSASEASAPLLSDSDSSS